MLYFYDDARARTFEPFASTRPISEMLAGAALIRDRWQSVFKQHQSELLVGPGLRHFDEPGGSRAASGRLGAGSVVVNSRCVPILLAPETVDPARADVWMCEGEIAAVRLGAEVDAARFSDGSLTLDHLAEHATSGADIPGWWLAEVWDFVRLLPSMLTDDLSRVAAHASAVADLPRIAPPDHAVIRGEHPVMILGAAEDAKLPGAIVESHVVFDASAGPILVSHGAHVHAFTRINGPCYIGPNTQVMGGDISSCSIGETCKVRGELSNTIILGHSNKGHDGFVGHSYLARWVNLGASTVTSNLKNTYGSVALWTPSGVRDTGMQFLGTMFGDHAKTGIGTRLTTGTVLGAGANVYGSTMPPKVVAPFSWGEAPNYVTYELAKFLETAQRMMSRRHIELSDDARTHLTAVHASRWRADVADGRKGPTAR